MSSASDFLMSPADGTAERCSASALLAGEESDWLVFQVLFLHVVERFGHTKKQFHIAKTRQLEISAISRYFK